MELPPRHLSATGGLFAGRSPLYEGVRIGLAGRLGGAEMSRKEELKKGRIPLQTFRADIDFASEEAYLPYGVIGIKVWIYRGNVYQDKKTKVQMPDA